LYLQEWSPLLSGHNSDVLRYQDTTKLSPKSESTPLLRLLIHYRSGGFIRGGLLYNVCGCLCIHVCTVHNFSNFSCKILEFLKIFNKDISFWQIKKNMFWDIFKITWFGSIILLYCSEKKLLKYLGNLTCR
jgi:hypothetical protein